MGFVWVGGWVGGWVSVANITEAVFHMALWWVGGWVGGLWEDRGERGGLNELLFVWDRWVGGWLVGGVDGWMQ